MFFNSFALFFTRSGMNELLAPMYYVFCQEKPDGVVDSNSSDAASESSVYVSNAEADAFFCFSQLMSEMRDRFIKSLDAEPTGILAALKRLEDALKSVDPPLYHHLTVRNQVDSRFFAFRWLTLLLSQEFELPGISEFPVRISMLLLCVFVVC